MSEIKLIYCDSAEWNSWNNKLTYEQGFLLGAIVIFENNLIQGQVIIYANPHHQINNSKTISLGNINLPDDDYTFSEVHNLSIVAATKLEAKYIISPMDGSTWNNYRFASFQPQSPFFLETTNEEYPLQQFKKLGYKVYANYISSISNKIFHYWEKNKSKYDSFIEMGMEFHNFNLDQAEEEFRDLATFCNSAFRKNLFFSPISEDEFVEKMMKVIPILNPAYTIIARMNEKIAGFIFAYQDINSKDTKNIIVKTLARDIDQPYGGLGSVLSSLSMRAVEKDGFENCIHALMYDNNISTNISSNFHGKILSKYELLFYTI